MISTSALTDPPLPPSRGERAASMLSECEDESGPRNGALRGISHGVSDGCWRERGALESRRQHAPLTCPSNGVWRDLAAEELLTARLQPASVERLSFEPPSRRRCYSLTQLIVRSGASNGAQICGTPRRAPRSRVAAAAARAMMRHAQYDSN